MFTECGEASRVREAYALVLNRVGVHVGIVELIHAELWSTCEPTRFPSTSFIIARTILTMTNQLAPASNVLRGWCLFLALFEVPNVLKVLQGAPLKGFQSRIADTVTTRRLWATFLSFLAFARVAVVAAPRSRPVLIHNAAIHVVEALFMVPESQLVSGGGQGGKINALVIIANAIIFCWDAFNRKR